MRIWEIHGEFAGPPVRLHKIDMFTWSPVYKYIPLMFTPCTGAAIQTLSLFIYTAGVPAYPGSRRLNKQSELIQIIYEQFGLITWLPGYKN